MTDSLVVNQMLPGVHKVRARRGDDRYFEYWYAWRGGPQVLSVCGSSPEARDAAVLKAAPEAIAKFQSNASTDDHTTLYGMFVRYLEFMKTLTNISERTKSDRRKHLSIAKQELGEMEVRALESKKARPFFIAWRDGRAATPKTADDLLGAVSTVFNWAVDRGELTRNPVAEFPRIYTVDRSLIIWTEDQLRLLLSFADPDTARAIKLAAYTGLRKSDLIRLPWTAIRSNAIVLQTQKSKGRKTVVIPITSAISAVLEEIPRRGVTVLTSSDCLPWKAPGHGLDSAVRRARQDAIEHVRKVEGADAADPFEGLRFHDLRGTAAHFFLKAGFEAMEVGDVFGWQLDQVHEIQKRYVSTDAIAEGMLAKLEFKNRSKTKAVKRAVKRS